MRDWSVCASTARIDKNMAGVRDDHHVELPIEALEELISLTVPDQRESEHIWDLVAVAESIGQFAKLHKQSKGYLYVDRERGLKENRRETQGILDVGEAARVPDDKVTLFLLRTRPMPGKNPSWWPQIRFPDGRYAFAFAG